MSVYGGPDIVTDGLVLHLDAANRKSYPLTGSTWYDLSGNGNNATRYNATYSNNYFTFDGTDDFFVVPNNASVTLNGSYLTLSAWVNVNNFVTGAFGTFLHKDLGYTIAFYDNKKITYADRSNWSYSNFGFYGNFVENTWYHIAAVKNGTNVTIYSNAEIVISKTFGSAINDIAARNLFIGAYGLDGINTGTNDFDGKISNAQIYNKALTANEVQQNYNALKGRFGL